MDDVEGVQRHNEPADRSVAVLAARQYGVFSRDQARARGLSARQIQLRVTAGRWEVVLPRAYRIAGAPGQDPQLAMAGVLWAGPGSLVSHATAGALWGIEGIRARGVELSIPGARGSRSSLVTVHRGSRLDRADRTMLGPLPITTPARALIDIAGRLEDDALLSAMESLFRRDLGTPERLTARVQALRSAGRPGLGRLARLLEERSEGRALESRLEARVWLLLHRARVPMPVRQHSVVAGGRRFRLDFAWPVARVALECDGWEQHATRSGFRSERARYAELASANWRVLPITWDAATRESERVIDWVRAALGHAA